MQKLVINSTACSGKTWNKCSKVEQMANDIQPLRTQSNEDGERERTDQTMTTVLLRISPLPFITLRRDMPYNPPYIHNHLVQKNK